LAAASYGNRLKEIDEPSGGMNEWAEEKLVGSTIEN